MDENERNEKILAEQAKFQKELSAMQKTQAHLFDSVMLEGMRTPTTVLRFTIEMVDGARVIRNLPAGYPA